MFNLIEKYMNRITISDVNNFAISKGVSLNNEELEFTYNFIKKKFYKLYILKSALKPHLHLFL